MRKQLWEASLASTVWAITLDGLAALTEIHKQIVARSGTMSAEEIDAVLEANEEVGQALHSNNLTTLQLASADGFKGIPYEGTNYGTFMSNGVVVLDLMGPIMPRASMMTRMSGATALSQFANDFIRAHNDPDVKGIVYNVDSPGGDARGMSDAAMLMYSYSKKRKKPIKAFASGFMASAAYYIAASAQEIVSSRGGFIGSIGVVSSARSPSPGEYEITSSKSPYKRNDPATAEGRGVITEFVDQVAQVMYEDIAKMKGQSLDEFFKVFGEGKMFAGPDAKSQGLADRIGTLGSVIESVASEAQSGSHRPVRKVSTEVAALLSFDTDEDTDMGLKSMVDKFRKSNEVLEQTSENDDKAQSNAATGDESETPGAAADQAPVTYNREELEEQFADSAELFAQNMTLASRIFPAEQAHAACIFLNAKIDDKIFGGNVSFVNAKGEVIEGTREEMVRAGFDARPKHTMTQRAIAGIKDGSVEAKILKEEDKESKNSKEADTAPLSEERRNELLKLSQTGRNVLAAGK